MKGAPATRSGREESGSEQSPGVGAEKASGTPSSCREERSSAPARAGKGPSLSGDRRGKAQLEMLDELEEQLHSSMADTWREDAARSGGDRTKKLLASSKKDRRDAVLPGLDHGSVRVSADAAEHVMPSVNESPLQKDAKVAEQHKRLIRSPKAAEAAESAVSRSPPLKDLLLSIDVGQEDMKRVEAKVRASPHHLPRISTEPAESAPFEETAPARLLSVGSAESLPHLLLQKLQPIAAERRPSTQRNASPHRGGRFTMDRHTELERLNRSRSRAHIGLKKGHHLNNPVSKSLLAADSSAGFSSLAHGHLYDRPQKAEEEDAARMAKAEEESEMAKAPAAPKQLLGHAKARTLKNQPNPQRKHTLNSQGEIASPAARQDSAPPPISKEETIAEPAAGKSLEGGEPCEQGALWEERPGDSTAVLNRITPMASLPSAESAAVLEGGKYQKPDEGKRAVRSSLDNIQPSEGSPRIASNTALLSRHESEGSGHPDSSPAVDAKRPKESQPEGQPSSAAPQNKDKDAPVVEEACFIASAPPASEEGGSAPGSKAVPPGPDRPVGGSGAYNLDNLEELERMMYQPSGKARQVKAAKLAAKAAAPAEQSLAEPVPPPAPTAERPLGGKGAYNFDNLEDMEKMYQPSQKPIQRKRPINEEKPAPQDVPPKSEGNAPAGSEEGALLPKPPAVRPALRAAAKRLEPKEPTPQPAKAAEAETAAQPKEYDDTAVATAPDEQGQPLADRLKSPNAGTRACAYIELARWEDAELTPEAFCKALHLTVKEKAPVVIDKILSCLEGLMSARAPALALVDWRKFMQNFTEFLMHNVRGGSKAHSEAFLLRHWQAAASRDALMEDIKSVLAANKPRAVEKALAILLALLRAGKVEELKYLKPFWPEVERHSRTAALRPACMEVYREAFLWLGEALRPFLSGLKKPQLDELEAHFATVATAEMKTVRAEGAAGRPVDAFEIADEAALPAEYAAEDWGERVAALPKWKERKERLDKLNEDLLPLVKLSPKANYQGILPLLKQELDGKLVLVHVSAVRTLELLASAGRRNFAPHARAFLRPLLGKLREKNRQLTEAVFAAVDKFFLVLGLEEAMDDVEQLLREKSDDLKLGLLRILGGVAERGEKLRKPELACRVVSALLRLVDASDSRIRDEASRVVAQLRDRFPDRVAPLLKDLNQQKMAKIVGLSALRAPEAAPAAAAAREDPRPREPRRKGVGTDKSDRIAEMRRTLFSNITVKISDVKNFSFFLENSLKQLAEMTKDFREVNASQAAEVCLLVEQLGQKTDHRALTEDARRHLATFYCEQLNVRAAEELARSAEAYVASRLITPRNFLGDVFDLLGQKGAKVSKDLLALVLRVLEQEIAAQGFAALPLKGFAEFLKTHFASAAASAAHKAMVLQTVRLLQKRHGDRALADLPANLLKELEAQRAEMDKAFVRVLDKLSDRAAEKRAAAFADLLAIAEPAKLNQFWGDARFTDFLRRSLIVETSVAIYRSLFQLAEKYLELRQNCPAEFSLKAFLAVFAEITTQYYNRAELTKEKAQVLDAGFLRLVNIVTPSCVFNELMADRDSAASRPQIFNFFLQFSAAIAPELRFITFITAALADRRLTPELRILIDNVLLALKNTHKDEVIEEGNKVRYIREVWQKNEDDVLFNLKFVQGNRVFDEPSLYSTTRAFLKAALGLGDAAFFLQGADEVLLDAADEKLKPKLVFFYLRCIEAQPQVVAHVFRELSALRVADLDEVCLLLVAKILLNFLKNLYFDYEGGLFQEVWDRLVAVAHEAPDGAKELLRRLCLEEADLSFATLLFTGHEESAAPDDAASRASAPPPRRAEPQIPASASAKNLRSAAKEDAPRNRDLSPLSKASGAARGLPDEERELQTVLRNLLQMEAGSLERAAEYFQRLLAENAPRQRAFLLAHADAIVRAYAAFLDRLFERGINYDLEKPSYELVFLPLYGFGQVGEFLDALAQDALTLLTRQLLVRLVCANDEKVSFEAAPDDYAFEADLAGFVLKNFNSIMLRLIEHASPDALFTALFALIFSAKEQPEQPLLQAVSNVAFKSCRRMVKNFRRNIARLDPRVFLRLVHKYLCVFADEPDSLNTRNMKTFLNELVMRVDSDTVWDSYSAVFGNNYDLPIGRLIRKLQERQRNDASANADARGEDEISQINSEMMQESGLQMRSTALRQASRK